MNYDSFSKEFEKININFGDFGDDFIKLVYDTFSQEKDDIFAKAVQILLSELKRKPKLADFIEAVRKAKEQYAPKTLHKPSFIDGKPTYYCDICLDTGYITAIFKNNLFNRDYEFAVKCPSDTCKAEKLYEDFGEIARRDKFEFKGFKKRFIQLTDNESIDSLFDIVQNEFGRSEFKKISVSE